MRGERPTPIPPAEQIWRWIHDDGETLQTLWAKIRTPAIREELKRQLEQQAKEARAPKVVTTPVVCGG